jgi:two-component system, NarL family, response regulator DevR
MNAADVIRVLVVDDHQMMGEGLRAALATEPGIEVIGVAGDLLESRAMADRLRPDVVLMDYALPSGTGFDSAQLLKQDHPEVKVIILTGHRDDTLVVRAVELGLDGFLRKTSSIAEVVAAVRQAQAGDAVFSPQDLTLVMRQVRRAGKSPTDLTEREVEVLHLMASGTSTEVMASTLFVSAHTIRSHVRHILEKLGAHSKLEAVAIAIRERLVDVSPA